MARIPQLSAETVRGRAGEWLRAMPIKLNLFGVLAQAEGCLAPLMGFGGSLLSNLVLPDRDRELLVLLVARLQSAEYEWTHHAPIAMALGLSVEAIAALNRLDLVEPFDERDRAILEFGRQVILTSDLDDIAFDQAKRFLSDRELIEAVLAIGYYMTMCRVLKVARTDIDADHSAALKLFNLSRKPATAVPAKA